MGLDQLRCPLGAAELTGASSAFSGGIIEILKSQRYLKVRGSPEDCPCTASASQRFKKNHLLVKKYNQQKYVALSVINDRPAAGYFFFFLNFKHKYHWRAISYLNFARALTNANTAHRRKHCRNGSLSELHALKYHVG